MGLEFLGLDSNYNNSKYSDIMYLLSERRRLNRDTIIFIVGEKRTGKSYSAIRLGEAIQKSWGLEPFDVTKQLFFEPEGFVKFFQTNTNKVVILDEASLSLDTRQWFSVESKILNSLLQTQGFRRNIVLLTSPTLADFDKRSLGFGHFMILTYKVGFSKVYRIKINQLFKKQIFQPIQTLSFELPREKNVRNYEEMKKKFNDEKLEDDMDFFEALKNKDNYTKKFNSKQYLQAFKKGVMDEEKLKERLLQSGYGADDIQVMIELEKQNVKPEEEEVPLIDQI